jgi:hypothetical protein
MCAHTDSFYERGAFHESCFLNGKYIGYPESKFQWAIKKNKNILQTMYMATGCTYHTLLFDIVSTIIEALVITLQQFLYPFIIE